MAEWIDIGNTLLGAALALTGVIITNTMNWISKKKQREQDMWRLKMESISKSAPLYVKISLYNAWNMSDMLNRDNKTRTEDDYKKMMYHLCNILNLKKTINNTIGDIQLTDLDSETIIGDLLRTIYDGVNKHFDHLETSKMTYLTDNDLPYHEFHTKISNGGDSHDLYSKFKQWISQQNISKELQTNCRWFTELMMYELNHIYQIWYGEKPQFDKLSVGLRNYLEEKHSEYYRRIVKLETGSHLK